MSALYLLVLNGLRYGVWKDQVDQVLPVETVHQLPFSPAFIAGLAVIDKQKTALVDLPLLIGMPPISRKTISYALLVSGKEKRTGFAVSGPVQEIAVADGAIRQLPSYLQTPVIENCIVEEELPVPIVDLARLYEQVHAKEPPVLEPWLPVPDIVPGQMAAPECLNLFVAGNALFGMRTEVGNVQFATPGRLFPHPFTPPWLKGSTCLGDRVMPVIHLAQRMQLPSEGGAGRILTCTFAAAPFGFLVDTDLSPLSPSEFVGLSLPPLLESPWISSLAIHDGQLIPVVNPVAVLAPHQDVPEGGADVAARYHPDSNFEATYGREDLAVREFMLLGSRHAIPDVEIEDVVPFRACRWIPGEKSIVAGVAEHQGEALPVLDLGMVFGLPSHYSADWSLVLIKNGDFRAFVITPAIYPARILPPKIQKRVPVSLPQDFVYGCYPEKDDVRLIFNIEALAVHFCEAVVKEFLLAMTKEMATVPEQMFPELSIGSLSALVVDEANAAPAEPASDTGVAEAAGGPEELAAEEQEPDGPGLEAAEIPTPAEPASDTGVAEAAGGPEELAAEEQEPDGPGFEAVEVPTPAEPASDTGVAEAAGGPEELAAEELEPDVPGLEAAEVPAPAEPASDAGVTEAAGELENEAVVAMVEQVVVAIDDNIAPENPPPTEQQETTSNKVGAPDSSRHVDDASIPAGQKTSAVMEAASLEGTEANQAPVAAIGEGEAGNQAWRQRDEALAAMFASRKGNGRIGEKDRRKSRWGILLLLVLLLVGFSGYYFLSPIFIERVRQMLRVDHDEPGRSRPITHKERSGPPELQQSRASEKALSKDGDAKTPTDSLMRSDQQKKMEVEVAAVPHDNKTVQKADGGQGEMKGQMFAQDLTAQAEHDGRKGAYPEIVPDQKKRIILSPEKLYPDSQLYIVRKGDTLWGISKRYTGDPFNFVILAQDNDIANPNLIYPRQKLYLNMTEDRP